MCIWAMKTSLVMLVASTTMYYQSVYAVRLLYTKNGAQHGTVIDLSMLIPKTVVGLIKFQICPC